MKQLAVIGGTGINQWSELKLDHEREFDTPYGPPSGPINVGTVRNRPGLFLARHGQGHRLPPHKINYRANLWALREAGASEILAVAAVGAIAPWFTPGTIALPEDVIDYTWGREHTYSDGSADASLDHVDFSTPYSESLRRRLSGLANSVDVSIAGKGVMGVTQGPRLESPAEVRRMQGDGCDMVGMTSMPEAALAAELGLPYACIAVSVNWAAGIGSGDIHAEIAESIDQGMRQVRALLSGYFEASDC